MNVQGQVQDIGGQVTPALGPGLLLGRSTPEAVLVLVVAVLEDPLESHTDPGQGAPVGRGEEVTEAGAAGPGAPCHLGGDMEAAG